VVVMMSLVAQNFTPQSTWKTFYLNPILDKTEAICIILLYLG